MGIIKSTLYKLSHRSLISLFRKQTIFPCYHLVSNHAEPHIQHLYQFQNVELFKNDIRFLLKNYKPLEPGQLINSILNNEGIPENSFLISFDDGLKEIYSVVFPILQEFGIKAIFFINPAFVNNKQSFYRHDISIILSQLKDLNYDRSILNKICAVLSIDFISASDVLNKIKRIKYTERVKVSEILSVLDINMSKYLDEHKPYVSTEQIREMINAGFYFGGHSFTHPHLNDLPFEEQKHEIISSIEWLKSNFGIKYALFAFPFTDKGVSEI
jgi:hypothetical protein